MSRRAAAEPKPFEILNEVARIATLDLELRPMMQRITDALARHFGWELVALAMVDAARNMFVCEAVTSTRPTDIHPGYRRPLGSGIVGEVALTEKAVVVDDVAIHPNYVETMSGTVSEICVPVKHGDTLVAVLNLESTRRAAFHDMLPLLTAVGDQIAGAIASARMYDELKRRVRLMEMITEVSRTALEATDLSELLDRIVHYIKDRFPVEFAAIMMHDRDRNDFIQNALAGPINIPRGTRRPTSAGVVGRCIRTAQPQLVRDVRSDPDYIAIHAKTGAELAIPIRFRQEVLAVLNLESESEEVFSPENVMVFMAFADQMAGAIRMFRLNQRLDEESRALMEANAHLTTISTTDSLTGTANRRHFDTVLEHEWRRAIRHRSPLSLLMIDIDDFKLYNDTFGHQSGDECLRNVSFALQGMLLRAGDLVARYGGEEFAVLLADTEEEDAERLAESLRARVASLGIEHRDARNGAGVVTISIGVASILPRRESTPAILIASADEALYRAKHAGKNCVSR